MIVAVYSAKGGVGKSTLAANAPKPTDSPARTAPVVIQQFAVRMAFLTAAGGEPQSRPSTGQPNGSLKKRTAPGRPALCVNGDRS